MLTLRGVLPIEGYTGRLRPKGVPFLACSILKGRENCHFSIRKGHKIRIKAKEMAAKVKYMKGCQIVADVTKRNK